MEGWGEDGVIGVILGSAAAALLRYATIHDIVSTSLEVERIPGAIVYFDSSLRIASQSGSGSAWDAFGSFSILIPVSVIQ